MGTITINIKDEVEREFKAVAGIAHGDEKAYLERAVTDAMQRWIEEKKQGKIAEEALKLIEQGFDFGKKLYKDRKDLYER
jgi:predicted transcriptional regulator